MIIQITDSEYVFLDNIFLNIKINHTIIDEFVSKFKELIFKVECIKYATLVITKISKGNNLENRN